MRVADITNMLRRVRLSQPKGIRSAVMALDEALREISQVDLHALELTNEKRMYITAWPKGLSTSDLSVKLNIPHVQNYRWTVLQRDVAVPIGGCAGGEISTLHIPLFDGPERFGTWCALSRGGMPFGEPHEEAFSLLSEVISTAVRPFAVRDSRFGRSDRELSMRDELLDAVGDELMMRGVLLDLMDLSRGEFCAFYTCGAERCLYVMLDSRELSPRVPYIREKLRTAFGMFTNNSVEERVLHEKVYYRSPASNVTYLIGDSRVESYFLVPVMSGSGVAGVLFVGSVRSDAFLRETISTFRRFSDDAADGTPLIYRVGGETGILKTIVDALPFGAALISPGGAIVCANDAFQEALRMHGQYPETVGEIGLVSPFNLGGVWEEYRVLQHDVVDRELLEQDAADRCLAVTWIKLGDLSEDVDSIVLLRDVTGAKKTEQAREEMLATVAHELRTPMTALKNSLEILMESAAARDDVSTAASHSKEAAAPRFLSTALRTIERLAMLVDGLMDVSTVRRPDHPLRAERIDARRLLDDAVLLFDESMKRKEIDYSVHVDDGIPYLLCDRNRMEQVIQNLLSNSLKHVPAGGAISVSVAPCTNGCERVSPSLPWKYIGEPRFVDICVSDTGGGIPPSVIEDLGDASDPLKISKGPPKGLGLHIADRLMRLHGGSLVIESGRDDGSAVHLYLPANAAAAAVVQTARPIEKSVEGMIQKGFSPVLYTVIKEDSTCWLDIAAGWKERPVVNPRQEDITDTGVYLWPFGERFAIALASGSHVSKNPLGLMRHAGGNVRVADGEQARRLRVGWAAGPRDGLSFTKLIQVSIARTGVDSDHAVREGAAL